MVSNCYVLLWKLPYGSDFFFTFITVCENWSMFRFSRMYRLFKRPSHPSAFLLFQNKGFIFLKKRDSILPFVLQKDSLDILQKTETHRDSKNVWMQTRFKIRKPWKVNYIFHLTKLPTLNSSCERPHSNVLPWESCSVWKHKQQLGKLNVEWHRAFSINDFEANGNERKLCVWNVKRISETVQGIG